MERLLLFDYRAYPVSEALHNAKVLCLAEPLPQSTS
jgi:hypothetical protein